MSILKLNLQVNEELINKGLFVSECPEMIYGTDNDVVFKEMKGEIKVEKIAHWMYVYKLTKNNMIVYLLTNNKIVVYLLTKNNMLVYLLTKNSMFVYILTNNNMFVYLLTNNYIRTFFYRYSYLSKQKCIFCNKWYLKI